MESYTIAQARRAFLTDKFLTCFDAAPTHWFSAPGRTEIGGNHTDHQQGRVLAAAVDLDMLAAVRPTKTGLIRVMSQGYAMCVVDTKELAPVPQEKNTTAALVRGVAAGFARLGCEIGGFDACVTSNVLTGAGLSSSAAFEVLLGTILNHLYFAGKASPLEVAKIGQAAENVYFGKPCGLMDQATSAVGNLVAIDFADRENPVVTPIDFDFAAAGHALCILDTGASHAHLTDAYAAIPKELQTVCAYFGKQVLREVPEEAFYAELPGLRKKCGDRAVLRAMHVYGENERVLGQTAALLQNDFHTFLSLVSESGRSSYMYLQNVLRSGSSAACQEMAFTLGLCDHLLQGKGAFRVHGGGFAGTVQAFVPMEMLAFFRREMEKVLGAGKCHVLSIRPWGGIKIAGEAAAIF